MLRSQRSRRRRRQQRPTSSSCPGPSGCAEEGKDGDSDHETTSSSGRTLISQERGLELLLKPPGPLSSPNRTTKRVMEKVKFIYKFLILQLLFLLWLIDIILYFFILIYSVCFEASYTIDTVNLMCIWVTVWLSGCIIYHNHPQIPPFLEGCLLWLTAALQKSEIWLKMIAFKSYPALSLSLFFHLLSISALSCQAK